MPASFSQHAANALTGLRVVLTPAFVVAVWRGDAHIVAGAAAVAIFAVAAVSDVFDGRLARRCGSASDAGRAFDHFADIGFILSALSTYAALGTAPWWVPAVIAGTFTFYVLDSWSHPGNGVRHLVSSRIGHAGGVLNYAVVGILVCNNTAGIQLLSAAVLHKLFLLVPIYSTLAVVARLFPIILQLPTHGGRGEHLRARRPPGEGRPAPAPPVRRVGSR
jgi:CDP-diacylglycerol--glycerol-3-phosphate 3-phosphatidyltransferase